MEESDEIVRIEMIKQKKIFPMNNMNDSHTTLSLLLLLLVPISKVSKFVKTSRICARYLF